MRFEDTPNYGHFQDEIAQRDIYKLRETIALPPDVIFDIGANIGVYTHCARKLYPQALIVAVEPHPENFAVLQEHAPKENVVLLNKAVGTGQVFRNPDVQSGDRSETSAGESYFTAGFGYEPPDVPNHPVAIPSVMLDELHKQYVRPGQRLAIKMDCEGAENILFAHLPSVDVLKRTDFLAMELHPFWSGGKLKEDGVFPRRIQSLLQDTHRVDFETPYFYAWRKPEGEPIAGRGDFGLLLKERNLLDCAAEIGVCTGMFSRDILDFGVRHLYLVDPWREINGVCGISDEQHEAYYQECLGYIRSYGDRASILRMTSVEAAKVVPDCSLNFCYIDADHSYEGISVDLPTWWPKVRPDGILAGHDYLAQGLGVNRAVKEFAEARNLKIHVVIEHVQDASFWLEKPNAV